MRIAFASLVLIGCNGQLALSPSDAWPVEAATSDTDASPVDAATSDVDASIASARPRFVAVDATRVYWAEASAAAGIGWRSKTGSASGVLPLQPWANSAVRAIAVNSAQVYVAIDQGIASVGKDGSPSGSTGPSTIHGLSAVSTGGAIAYVGLDQGAFACDTIGVGLLVTDYKDLVYAIATDDAALYWSEFPTSSSCAAPAGRIAMRAKNSTNEVALADARVPAFGLASNGSALYWTDACAHTLTRIVPGGMAAIVASNVEGALVVDAKRAYVLAGNALSSIALADGTVSKLANVPNAGPNLAQDDDAIYVASDNAVVSIAKPQ